MLKKVSKSNFKKVKGNFAIVASTYNDEYVGPMATAAQELFASHASGKTLLIRVPGAFEIPTVVAALARQKVKRWAGIVCLGVILRGETTHAQHIGDTVSRLLGQIGVDSGIPIIHEVLLLENRAQAEKRCLDPEHNRGAEAAQTALSMAEVMQALK